MKIILALLIPLILSLIILSTIGTNLINTGISDVAQDHQKSLAFQISMRLSDALDHYPGYLLSLFSDMRTWTDSNHIDQNINQINRTGMDLIFDQGIGVYTDSGKLIAHSSWQNTKWENLSPLLVKSLIATRTAQYTSLNKSIKLPYLSVFVPVITEERGVIAIFEGRISPEYSLFGSRLIDILEIESGSAGYALLIDGEGNILYQRFQGDIYEEIGSKLTSAFQDDVIRDTSSTVIRNDITGKDQFAGYHIVPGTNWAVIAHEDRKAILNDMDQYLYLTYLLIGGVFIVSIFLIVLLINQFLNPLRTLLNGVRQVREGILEPYPFPPYHDEFEVLTTEFNRMISVLKTSFVDLDSSRKRYQTILNQASDGFILLDEKTLSIEESNRMSHTITGYSANELKNRQFVTLFDEKDAKKFKNIINSLTSEGINGEVEARLRRPDNKQIFTEIKITRIIIDTISYFQVTIRDITDKVVAEEKIRKGIQMLAKNQETLAILNDQIRNPLMVIALHLDGIEQEKEKAIMHEISRIDDIITELDRGWLKSDKVRNIMKKHYDINVEELH